MLHMCQEIALLIAHSAINLAMKRNNIPIVNIQNFFLATVRLVLFLQDIGTGVGILLQYCFIANFIFLTLEALQTYCIMQHVLNTGGYFNYKTNLLLGWGLPMPIVGLTVFLYLSEYHSLLS